MFVSSSTSKLAPPSFEGYRVLLPCISVGNVGQLAVDLIVNTLRLPRVGYLDHPAILPMVGNDPFDHTQPTGSLHTAAEVYQSAKLKLLVVQLRTPLSKGLRGAFCVKFLEWVKEVGMAEVVVLTSSHAHERRDSQITGDQFRFLLNPLASGNYSHFTEELKWKVLEPRTAELHSYRDSSPPPPPSGEGEGEDSPGVLQYSSVFLPGSGMAKRLYKESGVLGIRLVVMVAFCIQGDNIQDAVAMGNRVDSWMDINRKVNEKYPGNSDQKWLIPSSWNLMYGGPSPADIF